MRKRETNNSGPKTAGEALKPCPWCGRVPKVVRDMAIDDRHSMLYFIGCEYSHRRDDCPALPSVVAKTRDIAIALWNSRPTKPRTEKVTR